eukprot:COSAG03_NODE_29881_length_174_cov_32.653333_1_plen_58_part_11
MPPAAAIAPLRSSLPPARQLSALQPYSCTAADPACAPMPRTTAAMPPAAAIAALCSSP